MFILLSELLVTTLILSILITKTSSSVPNFSENTRIKIFPHSLGNHIPLLKEITSNNIPHSIHRSSDQKFKHNISNKSNNFLTHLKEIRTNVGFIRRKKEFNLFRNRNTNEISLSYKDVHVWTYLRNIPMLQLATQNHFQAIITSRQHNLHILSYKASICTKARLGNPHNPHSLAISYIPTNTENQVPSYTSFNLFGSNSAKSTTVFFGVINPNFLNTYNTKTFERQFEISYHFGKKHARIPWKQHTYESCPFLICTNTDNRIETCLLANVGKHNEEKKEYSQDSMGATTIVDKIKEGKISIETPLTEQYICPMEKLTFDKHKSFLHLTPPNNTLQVSQLLHNLWLEHKTQRYNHLVNDVNMHDPLPLLGVPIAIKDNICVSNTPTTAGSRILQTYRPSYDATVIRKIKEAGGIIIGKTNMDEFAMGCANNFVYLQTLNPLNHSLSPGGSSSGSSATVAGNEVSVSIGSDTGGSLRLPSAWCGTVTLRPTYGRVSRYGLISYASSLDVIGPISRSVQDCALLLSIISGFDSNDYTTICEEVPPYHKLLKEFISSKVFRSEQPLKGYRIGLIQDNSIHNSEENVLYTYKHVCNMLYALGAKLVKIDFGISLEELVNTYYITSTSESVSNLARYDGQLYGLKNLALSNKALNYEDLITSIRSEYLSSVTKKRLVLGGLCIHNRPFKNAKTLYEKAIITRKLLKEQLSYIFESIDLILTPSTPSLPRPIKATISDSWNDEIFLTVASLAGLPALCLPVCNKYNSSLPHSIQLIANKMQELSLLKVGSVLQQPLSSADTI